MEVSCWGPGETNLRLRANLLKKDMWPHASSQELGGYWTVPPCGWPQGTLSPEAVTAGGAGCGLFFFFFFSLESPRNPACSYWPLTAADPYLLPWRGQGFHL